MMQSFQWNPSRGWGLLALWVGGIGLLQGLKPAPLPSIGQPRWRFSIREPIDCPRLSPLSTWALRDTDGDVWVRWKYSNGSWVLRRYDPQGRPRPVPADLERRGRRQHPQIVAPPMRLFATEEWCIAWDASNSGLFCQKAGRPTWTVELGGRPGGTPFIIFGDYALDESSLWVVTDYPPTVARLGERPIAPDRVWRLVRLSRPSGRIAESDFPRPATPVSDCGTHSVVMTADKTLWLYLGEDRRLVRRESRGRIQELSWSSRYSCDGSGLSAWVDRLLYAPPWVVLSLFRKGGSTPEFILHAFDAQTARQVVEDLATGWQAVGTGADGTLILAVCGPAGLDIAGLAVGREGLGNSMGRRP